MAAWVFLQEPIRCHRCSGYGTVKENVNVQCRYCEGYGKQKCNDGNGNYNYWTKCPDCSHCRGSRFLVEKRDITCPNCNGKGYTEQWKSGCYCYKCQEGYRYCN